LASRQGGQIGVASQPGLGSTFSFFVQCHRCNAPESKVTRHTPGLPTASGGRRRSKAAILTAAATAEAEMQNHVTHELAVQKAGDLDDVTATEIHLLVVEGG